MISNILSVTENLVHDTTWFTSYSVFPDCEFSTLTATESERTATSHKHESASRINT